MLEIVIPKGEAFNNKTNEFIYWNDQKLVLEHSLLSISLWESVHHKPFLSSEKTNAEVIDYIRCMTINKNVDENAYYGLTTANIEAINEYIKDSRTATWFAEDKIENKAPKRKEIITSELIYYWMVAYQIPFECQKWHINRLLTLIRVYSEKNKEPKKMSKKDALAQRKSLNAARRAKYNSNG